MGEELLIKLGNSVPLSACGSGGSGGSDTTVPTVTLKSPTSAATGVALNSSVSAAFSEAINTVTTTSFSLAKTAGGAVAGTVGMNGGNTVATFSPSADLAGSTQYTASLTVGITDAAGNAITATSWNFTTTVAWAGTKQLGVAGKPTAGYGVATDSSGNIFVAGYTDGGLDGNTLTGTNDFFVTKYDPSGVKQ